MTKVPVARRRYDITPAEMLDLARTAVDAVVAELKSRSDEFLPDQLGRLEQVSQSLTDSVQEVAESARREQVLEIKAGMAAVREDISGAMADHDAQLVRAVEAHLAALDRPQSDPALPHQVAAAVLDGLDGSLPTIDKGIHELRELVGALLERGKQSDLTRTRSLDQLDQVLIDLRAGLTENVTRQHTVLLEMLDEKLGDLQLAEIAADLPKRIGAVISSAVQRSHELQEESLRQLAGEMAGALDAGLSRQRTAMVELESTSAKMAEAVAGFSVVAEEAVGVAFQRSQAAQSKRLSTMVDELRLSQQEAAAELVAAAEGALAGKLEASYDALGAQLRMSAMAAEKTQKAQGVAFGDAVRDLAGALDEAVAEVRGAQAEHAVTLSTELRSHLIDNLGAQIAPLRDAVVADTEASRESFAAMRAAQNEAAMSGAALVERVQGLTEVILASSAEVEDRLTQNSVLQAEVVASQTVELAALVTGQGEGVAARVDALIEEIEQTRADVQERLTQNSALQAEVVASQTVELADLVTGHGEGVAARVDALVREVERSRAEVAESRTAYEERLRDATERMSSHLSELMDSVPARVSSDIAAVLEETRARQDRVEKLIAELAWVLGEHRAGNEGLRDDLSKALAELPDSVASLREAALRSEARIIDQLARRIEDPDAR